jgi:microtubule-associated protein, RP/EB family
MDTPATVAPLATGRSTSGLGVGGGRAGGKTPVGGFRSGSAQPNEAIQQLQLQIKDLNGHLEGLEKERDFYFEKVCRLDVDRALIANEGLVATGN